MLSILIFVQRRFPCLYHVPLMRGPVQPHRLHCLFFFVMCGSFPHTEIEYRMRVLYKTNKCCNDLHLRGCILLDVDRFGRYILPYTTLTRHAHQYTSCVLDGSIDCLCSSARTTIGILDVSTHSISNVLIDK